MAEERHAKGIEVQDSPFSTPLHDASGALIDGVDLPVDITERRAAEHARAHLAAIVESSDDAIISKSLDGIITSWNHGAEATFGYRAEEIIGRPITLLFPPDRWNEEDAILDRIRRGERVDHFETVRRRKDGCEIDVSVTISPIRNAGGRIIGVSKIARDICERKRAEAIMRESEARLAAELAAAQQLQGISLELVQEQGADALYQKLVDAAALIMRADYASMQMLYPERGEKGELLLLATRGFDAEAAQFWKWVRADSGCTCGQALRTGRRVIASDVETCDFMAGTADRIAHLQAGVRAAQSTPLVSRSGRLLGMISTHWRAPHEPKEHELRRFDVLARQAADLLERTRAEAALRELNETLERRVEERTRALETEMHEREKAEAALHLAQRLEAIGQLTGGVAHDFNNLLTVVAGNLDLMRHMTSTSAEIPKDMLRRLIDGTQRAASRGERLTKQLLAFSRQGSVQPQVVELNDTIAGFAPFLQRVVGETIELHLDFAEERQYCKVDPAQFEAAALNLAINARDAMPKGGRLTLKTGRIAVGADEARVNPVLEPGPYSVVAVSDTGTGMAREIVEKVFEPFFTTKDVGKGSGLGLAQVWGFAKQSGGHVAIESEPGKGTTVTLYLPESREAAESDADEEQRIEQRGTETILVVEDDEFVREVTVEALSSLGYATVVARDGREALGVLDRAERIDLLFTDYVMPGGLSGADLAREARKRRPDLKVLLTSGYAKHAGAHDFPIIAKPYRRLELAETIRTVLAAEAQAAE